MSFQYLVEASFEHGQEILSSRFNDFSTQIYNSDRRYDDIESGWQVFHPGLDLVRSGTLVIISPAKIPKNTFLDYFCPISEDHRIRILRKSEGNEVKFLEIENYEETDLSENLGGIGITPLIWFSIHDYNLISTYAHNLGWREGNHLNNDYFNHIVECFNFFFPKEEINKDLDQKISLLKTQGIKF